MDVENRCSTANLQGRGTAGAGFATFLMALAYLYRNQEGFNFDFNPPSFKVDPVMLRALVKFYFLFVPRHKKKPQFDKKYFVCFQYFIKMTEV